MNTVPRQKLTLFLAIGLITAAVTTGAAEAAPQPLTPVASPPILTSPPLTPGDSGSSTGSFNPTDLTHLGTLALCVLGIQKGLICNWT